MEDLADSLKAFLVLVNKMSDVIKLTSDKSNKKLHLNFYESKFGKERIMINCDLYYQMFNLSQLRAYEPECHCNFYFMQEQD